MNSLNGVLESLQWESAFFGLPSAIVRLRDDASVLAEPDFIAWQRVQAKIRRSEPICLMRSSNTAFSWLKVR